MFPKLFLKLIYLGHLLTFFSEEGKKKVMLQTNYITTFSQITNVANSC